MPFRIAFVLELESWNSLFSIYVRVCCDRLAYYGPEDVPPIIPNMVERHTASNRRGQEIKGYAEQSTCEMTFASFTCKIDHGVAERGCRVENWYLMRYYTHEG